MLFTRRGSGKGRQSRAPSFGSSEFHANAYAFYARLRAVEPVSQVVLSQREKFWLVTRYDDVALVLRDERFAKNAAHALTPEQAARRPLYRKILKAIVPNPLTHQDPPDHTRLRALVNKAFTPRVVEQMRDRIQRLSDELLDAALARGRMDLIKDYALPLPITIIAEMLGVPVADRHRFRRWSLAGASIRPSLGAALKAAYGFLFLMRYMRGLIKQRRAQPQDDLVSALIRAEEAGNTLSEKELLAIVLLLLIAGHETTVNLIGNGTLALLQHPGEKARLQDQPALIKSAVEELLRYDSPLELATERYAREPVTIAGVTIERGELVYPVIASANRDERQFANADVLDITREPNKHLTFGLGTHFCVGAPLARLEGQIAIGTLLRRIPDLRLAVPSATLRWRPGLFFRALESLPLTFGTGRCAERQTGR